LKFAAAGERRGLGVREPVDYLGVPIEQVAIRAWPAHRGFDYLPVNFLVGDAVRLEGTIGHVKSVLDSMLRRGSLHQVIALKGTPTFLIGNVHDPHFEEHLREGPYLVFDDSAPPLYKNDPRVHFVPGHPVLRTAMPQIMKGLGLRWPGRAVMEWQQLERWGLHEWRYGSPVARVLTWSVPVAAAIAAALLVRRRLRDQ
jgi:hypothetical protein